MKKILFLIPTLKCGGAEKVLLEIVNNLPQYDFDITVQTIYDIGVFKNYLCKNVEYKTIVKKPHSFFGWIHTQLIQHIFSTRLIYNLYIKNNYDIEVAFLEGIASKIISDSSNKQALKIAWVHIDLMASFGSVKNYKNFNQNRECYKKFDKIACVSESVKEKFIERFGDTSNKIETIYNIIDDYHIIKLGCEPIQEYKHDFPIIVSCGRLTSQKGFDRLLHIHKKLLNEGLKHYLWIVGDGQLREQFISNIHDNEIEETTTLWGFQSNPYKFISKADLFVCSSISEGYSLVVTESVVLGVPAISTDVAGLKEPFDCPRCYKIVDNNEEALYFCIKEILTNKNELNYAKEYTKKIASNFSKEKYLNTIINFLGEKNE